MKDQKKSDEIVNQCFRLIAPLLAMGLDPGKAKQLKGQICQTSYLSERTKEIPFSIP
ncbi:hypothetical protein [Heyndrickxia acidicola]|uniref:Uncharacterized protein n=1 Tax=Heyndrickxia acidicola TaxID=209389 RepID=A0ABU6MBL0_9BACI|nr:hypothetical protein [Heyndrickxia acidicola]MED1201772.1 hypothetical protein [Heyndrickxia acidicola]